MMSLDEVLIVVVAVISIFSSEPLLSSSALKLVVPPVKKVPARFKSRVVVLPISTVPALPAALALPIPASVIAPVPDVLLISITPMATPELATSPIMPPTDIEPVPVVNVRLRAVPESSLLMVELKLIEPSLASASTVTASFKTAGPVTVTLPQ